MNPFTEYVIQNWALVLVLVAFAIMLKITIFLDKHTIIRLYVLIASVFLLSVIVFIEFYLAEINEHRVARSVMIAIRYSATPIIIALILFALVKRVRWYVMIPAFAFAVVNILSIFTGIVFSIDETGALERGVLGYLPYIAAGLYSIALVAVLIKQSNKQATEIIPIAFLAFAFASGLVLPFVIGKEYSKIFCTTIAVALFVYYVFLILQLTKKDALTGLLNRQAYYAAIRMYEKSITAFVSIDMNGLKRINDNEGHLAGDTALTDLSACFSRAATMKQSVYRIGGDEFIVICRKANENELRSFIDRVKKYVGATSYSCSIGYCYAPAGTQDLESMVKESDEMMYADKAKYYAESGIDRRQY